jgi:hypothetical protein
VIESFVDLTYRGLSLGRRIKLTQVRPGSATLELAAPMPVGTHVAVTTDEGVTFDATVSWVYEQIAGSERTPGMVVVPVLAADPALSWWKARVALPDEDQPKPRAPRGRPMTARPRSFTEPSPPPEGAITEEIPTNIADLNARVHAAAGVVPPRPAGAPQDPGEQAATAMTGLDRPVVPPQPRSVEEESAMRSTGEHAVIDDGRKTMIMTQVDPSTFDREPTTIRDADADASDASADVEASAADDAEAGAGEDGDEGEAGERAEAGEASRGDKPAAGRSFKKRRKRR